MLTRYYLSQIVNNPDVPTDNYMPDVMVHFERAMDTPSLDKVGMRAEVISGRKHYKAQDNMVSPTKKQREEVLLNKWCVVEILAPKRVHVWLGNNGFDSLTNSKSNLKKKAAKDKLKEKGEGLELDFIRRFR